MAGYRGEGGKLDWHWLVHPRRVTVSQSWSGFTGCVLGFVHALDSSQPSPLALAFSAALSAVDRSMCPSASWPSAPCFLESFLPASPFSPLADLLPVFPVWQWSYLVFPQKIKEITYMHSEGILAGELKHGPLALIDKQMPVIMVIMKDPCFAKCQNALQQVTARQVRALCHTCLLFSSTHARLTHRLPAPAMGVPAGE